jgi:hypothetical protein
MELKLMDGVSVSTFLLLRELTLQHLEFTWANRPLIVATDVVVGMITVDTVDHHPHITAVDLVTLVQDLTALVSTIESPK